MAADSFTIKIFTPAGLLLEDRTAEVKIPGKDGEIGVLSMHTRYVGVLGTGFLEFKSADGSAKRALVSGGFCTFKDDELVILADSVDLPDERARIDTAAEREKIRKQLEEISGFDPGWEALTEKLKRLDALDTLH